MSKIEPKTDDYNPATFAAFLRDLADQVESGQLIRENGGWLVTGPWSSSPQYRIYGDMTFTRPSKKEKRDV